MKPSSNESFLEKKDYFDITPEISEALGVWPGDTPFQRRIVMDYTKGDGYRLSTLTTTGHLGAHADAPNHYHPEGEGISTRSLRPYLGLAQVISISPSDQLTRRRRILPEDLRGIKIQAPRVLFRTLSFPDPAQWNQDFVALSPELIQWLSDQGVILVGIDTPSIDPFESKKLESHSIVYKNNLSVLEGIVLSEVPDALYTLVALPLKISGADASPVRAILLKGTL